MATTYSWEDTASGATRMTPRNRGEPSGFAQVAQPVLEQAMRRANTKDLARLKQILEQGPLAPVSVETPSDCRVEIRQVLYRFRDTALGSVPRAGSRGRPRTTGVMPPVCLGPARR
jgi:hypothetical protein